MIYLQNFYEVISNYLLGSLLVNSYLDAYNIGKIGLVWWVWLKDFFFFFWMTILAKKIFNYSKQLKLFFQPSFNYFCERINSMVDLLDLEKKDD